MLINTKSIAPTQLSPKMLLLYSRPKVGKTLAVSELPGCHIIRVEPGAERFHNSRSPEVIKDYNTLVEYIIAVSALKLDYVAVDTIDRVEDLCAIEATRYYKTTVQGKNFTGTSVATELPNGYGYRWLWDKFTPVVQLLETCAKHVIILGHVRDKFLEKEGDAVSIQEINLTGKCSEILTSRCDALGHLTRRGRKKGHPADPLVEDSWLSFKSHESLYAGSSYDYLSGKEFLFNTHEERKYRWPLIFPELGPVPASPLSPTTSVGNKQ